VTAATLPGSSRPSVRDPRLVPVADAIATGAFDVLSLDVFDTLLLREVVRPVDAFVLLAHRLVRDGLVRPFVTPALFATAREGAERRARTQRRHRGEYPEVTLAAIYEALPGTMLRGDRARLVEAELALEAELAFADLDVAQLARTARADGLRVVVVSDTYLSGEQVRMLLGRAGLEDLDATVFTSSDHGTGKSAALFDEVTRTLGVDAGRMLHVGDNVAADVDAARARGLVAFHLPLRSAGFDRVVRREGLLPPADGIDGIDRAEGANPADGPPLLDVDHGDHGVTALRARLEGAGAPATVAEHAHPHWVVGASVLGPVFTGFGDWVVERAAAYGVQRAACLMREGSFLAPLIADAAQHGDSRLDTAPLWLSRQVCARAALERGDYSELRIFVERRVAPTVRELCAVLRIAPSDLGDVGAHLDGRLDDVALREAVIGAITGDGAIREGLLADAAELRKRVVSVIESVRHPDDTSLLLVDLGWHATTQHLLVRALQLAGHDLPVTGLYLLTTDRLVETVFDGVEAEGFLGQAGLPRVTTDAIIRSPEMLEQLCMGTEGSVLDLDASGDPVLGRAGAPARQLDEARAAREGIMEFATRYRAVAARHDRSLAGAAPMLRAVLARFVGEPTAVEATAFGGWEHDDNFGTGTGDLLVHSELLHDGLYADVPHLREVDAYWPAGVVARDVPDDLGGDGRPDAVAAVDPAAELVGRAAPVTVGLYADTGGGFDEAHAVHRPVPVNVRGLSYVQLGVAADGVRALRLDPTSIPSLVRVDRVALRLAVRDQSDPVVLTFTTPDELAAWTLRDCEWLTGGLLVARSSDPQMLLDLGPRVRGHVYAVLASVAFTTMELPEAAFGDDGTVTLGAPASSPEIPRVVSDLRALVGEVRAAAARQLGSNRPGRRGYGL
jgi:FMN phosphatase YigB (HAD superfamily)